MFLEEALVIHVHRTLEADSYLKLNIIKMIYDKNVTK
jgi:hypothetical protein